MNESELISNVTAVTTLAQEISLFADFLDPWKRKLSEIFLNYVMCWTTAILGVVTNILVIIVYGKQGFRESISISMTTIAFWDLAKCLAGTMERCSGIIGLFDPAAALSWSNISVVVFNYLVCFSSYVTSVMAAYVAVERCLCVSVPLKVKWMLTRKVTLFACLLVSVVVFGCFVVMFGIYDIIWEWDETMNATIAIYKKNDFYYANDEPLFLYYNLSGILWPLAAFVVICVCTIIIVYKLSQGSKFRSQQQASSVFSDASATSSQQKQQNQPLSNRDRQVVKMLLVIISIYIACLFPRIAHYIVKYVIYDFYYLRKYHYLFIFVSYWILFCDIVNGAVNFFVFYAMSSSFRETFNEMFSSKKKNSNKIKSYSQSPGAPSSRTNTEL